MPATTAELVDLLRLTEEPDSVFIGRHPRTVMQRTYGGQVLAQSLMAAYSTVPEGRVAHSLNSYFIRPGQADIDIEYVVEPLRDGRTFSVRRVTALQDGRTIFTGSYSFHEMEEGLDHSDPIAAQVPSPDDCPGFLDISAERYGASPLWHEWDALDVRFAGDSSKGGLIEPANHPAHMRVWVRTTDALPENDTAIHQAVLAYLSDLTLLSVTVIPHSVAYLSPNLQVATLDHIMHFHRAVRADQWLLYDMLSPSASGSLGIATGRLFQGDKMVASCSQEGLIRVIEQERELLT